MQSAFMECMFNWISRASSFRRTSSESFSEKFRLEFRSRSRCLRSGLFGSLHFEEFMYSDGDFAIELSFDIPG